MSNIELAISDGTTTISLLDGIDCIYLNNWRPAVAQAKSGGTYQQSSLADGRRLADRRLDNVLETFDLKVKSEDQDAVARVLQNLRRLLDDAVHYWTTNWHDTPVYLLARAGCETEIRYAVIQNWATPGDENPFAQPFLQPQGAAIVNDWTLTIERGHWCENPPGTDQCVQASGTQEGKTYSIGTFVPTQSADDAYVEASTAGIDTGGNDLYFGLGAGITIFHTGIRFRNVTIPQGATIVQAYLEFEATGNDAGDCSTWILAEDNSAPAVFSTFADFMNRNWTAAGTRPVSWPDWTSGVIYDSEDCSPQVQAVVDRVDWASGNNLVLSVAASWGNSRRQAASWDHATADAPELHVVWETGETTFGRAATCNDEVYVANKHNLAYLTHCWIDDGGVFGGNLIGSGTPYNLLPAVPAVNDAIYFGVNTALTNSGPFCSLVFDLSQITDATFVWEYHNGAAWGTLTTRDNTNVFHTLGVNSVHWEQPSDWDETQAVNGITGYWVRARVTGIGTQPAIQQNRDMYTILWPYVDIDDAQVGGDLPALMEAYVKNHSYADTFTTFNLDAYRIICGLRTLSRGTNFTAYLNIADEQNPAGLTCTAGTDTAFATDDTTPTGRRATYSPVSLNAWYDVITFNFQATLADDFYGSFRVLMRAEQSGGSAGQIAFRLVSFYGSTELVLSGAQYFQSTNPWQVLDFGAIEFPGPPLTSAEVSQSSGFIIQAYSTSATPDAYLYDLILIPVDEWAGDFGARSEESEDSVQLIDYLDVDSLEPRYPVRALVRTESGDYVKTRWASITNGPAILQPNVDQRLWFFSMELRTDSSPELQAPPYHGFSIQLYRNQRYYSYRGDR